ncbi:eukaryotic translation initiation factor 2 subunit [Vairimorpha necatrix]|uniref:Eukaryotic translation initiation factor 2 subunit n=1 Tax=Vairimorpha necatrix TaxID=6039 RepID=A0AAX4J8G8_9MICR
MTSYECRFFKKKFPSEGEMIMGKVATVDSEGVSVDLLEYGDARGLILLGELSKKRIKNINQITKVGNLEVCIVLRVDDEKGYIDLSLAKVNDMEKEECKKNYAKNKIAYHILMKAAKKLNKSVKELYEEFGYDKAEEFGSLYFFFARVKEDESILENTELGLVIKKLIQDEFQASSYKVRADVEVTCPSNGGISSIKESFRKAHEKDSKLKISLLKTPTYSIVRTSSDKDKAYRVVQEACDIIESYIVEQGGAISIVGKSKLFGQKSKYSLLNIEDEEEDDESSD